MAGADVSKRFSFADTWNPPSSPHPGRYVACHRIYQVLEVYKEVRSTSLSSVIHLAQPDFLWGQAPRYMSMIRNLFISSIHSLFSTLYIMKFTLLFSMAAIASARPVAHLAKREVPQEHSYELFLRYISNFLPWEIERRRRSLGSITHLTSWIRCLDF